MRFTQSTTHEPLAALVHGEPWPWPTEDLTRAGPSDRSGTWWLVATDREMERVLWGFGFGPHRSLDDDEEAARRR
jgi:hypothetical protein